MAETSTPGPARTRTEFLQIVAQLTWHELPLLLVMSLVLAVSAIPAVGLLLLGLPLIASILAVVLAGPVLAAIAATTDQIYLRQTSSFGLFFRSIWTHARAGITTLAPIVLVATVIAETIGIWTRMPRSRWLVMPILLDISLLIILLICAVSAFSLSTTARFGCRQTFKASLNVFAISPIPTVGSLALCSMLVWLVASYAPWFPVLLVAPWLLLNSAITWSSIETYPDVLAQRDRDVGQKETR